MEQADGGFRGRRRPEHRFQRLLTDLRLVERRPLELAVARDDIRRAAHRLVDRGRGNPVKLVAGEPGRERDVVGDLGRERGAEHGLRQPVPAQMLHRARAKQRRFGVLGRRGPFLDEHGRDAARSKLQREHEPDRTATDDDDLGFDHGVA
jgi:hypothetical protein